MEILRLLSLLKRKGSESFSLVYLVFYFLSKECTIFSFQTVFGNLFFVKEYYRRDPLSRNNFMIWTF